MQGMAAEHDLAPKIVDVADTGRGLRIIMERVYPTGEKVTATKASVLNAQLMVDAKLHHNDILPPYKNLMYGYTASNPTPKLYAIDFGLATIVDKRARKAVSYK